MKVNLYKNNNVKVAIFNAIGNNVDLTKQFLEARDPNLKDDSGAPLDEVIFTVNGIELDFNNFINSFAEQWNSLVEARALEILKEKYQRIEEATIEIIEELENKRDYVLGYTRD